MQPTEEQHTLVQAVLPHQWANVSRPALQVSRAEAIQAGGQRIGHTRGALAQALNDAGKGAGIVAGFAQHEAA